MKVVNLDQRSQEWLDWRNGGIGASEAAIIMGISPWKTIHELYELKIGLRGPDPINPAMLRGIRLEDEARAAYIRMTGKDVFPLCGEHDELPFLRVSFDGISMLGEDAVEIKVPGAKAHAMAKEWIVPPYYMPQLQHQMLVGGLRKIDYFSYDPDDTEKSECLITVERNEFFLERYLEKAASFWENVIGRTPPAGKVFLDAARLWLAAKSELEAAKAALEERQTFLLSLTESEGSISAGGVSISRSKRKGSIDYDAFLKSAGKTKEDLELYRGLESEVVVVKPSTRTAVAEASAEMKANADEMLAPPPGLVSTAIPNEVIAW